MKPSIRPNKPKFAKKNQTTILAPKWARLMNDFYAIVFFAVAFIIGIALATHSMYDSCWSKSFDTPIVQNRLGVAGAYLSDVFYYLFGVSSWWIVIGIFYIGYRKIVRNKITTGNWFSIYQSISYLILLSASSTFEYIVFYGHDSSLPDGFGGSFGSFVVMSFYHSIGEVGLSIVTLILIIACFTFSFSVSWLYIAEKIGFAIEFIYIRLTKVVERKNDNTTFSTEIIKSENIDNINQPLVKDISRVDSPKFEFPSVPDDIHETNQDLNQVNFDLAVDNKDTYLEEKPNFMSRLFTHKQSQDISKIEVNDFSSGNDDFFIKDIEDEFIDNNFNLPDFNPNDANEDHIYEISKVDSHVATSSYRLDTKHYTSDLVSSMGSANLPLTSLLNLPQTQHETVTPEAIEFVSRKIEGSLADFGVAVSICNVESGPVITRYELIPPKGVKGDKIASYSKEIARALALPSIRIVENIVGKNSMGIEVPNFKRQTIYLKEIFDSKVYQENNSLLTLALGKDISGQVIVTDLAKMPHLLVAGTTGSGKSVSVNAMILSILFNATADQVKFIMIDPKMVELSFYQDIPHLLAPVVTDMSQAANALKWTVGEMERRYKLMAKIGTKKITDFNAKIEAAEKAGKPLFNPFSADLSDPEQLETWPYIVVIIDELADLMMVAGKKIEQYIARIAQKARAVGIHLIVATQRPSVDVITGLIKANIPARIAFQVSSKIDSRTILDQQGAEALLGQGDMLFLNPGSGFPRRIHGAYVNDDELHQVVEFLKKQGAPNYNDDILNGDVDVVIPGVEDESVGNDTSSIEKDTVFDQSVKFILESKRCSISSLQTQFGIGYNKAARIMNHLEKIGMVRRNDRGGFELLNHTLNS